MQTIMWTPSNSLGSEILDLSEIDSGILADGVVLGVRDRHPFRLRYRIECDARWMTRTADIELLDASNRRVTLRAIGGGAWADAEGRPIAALDGCLDVDLAATPFTNTLAIRRLGLQPGQSADLTVAYVGLPDLAVSAVRQRYTLRSTGPDGSIYHYEGLFRGFKADLAVDAQGLVLEYPQTWKRAIAVPDLPA